MLPYENFDGFSKNIIILRLTENLTVEHFFSCPSLQHLRNSFSVASSVSSALSNNHQTVSNFLLYLEQTRFHPLW